MKDNMHSIKENHIDDLCPNCRQPHGNEWKDDWLGEIHYQITNCKNCDFEIFKRNDEFTSGKFQ